MSTLSVLLGLVAAAVLVAAFRLLRRPVEAVAVVLDTEDLARLDDLGFFRFVPPDRLAEVRAAVARTAWPFWVEGTCRFLLTDAEDLAEGGVARFVDELRPLLALRGVEPGEVMDCWDTDYRVTVAGREVLIWSAEEAARERERDLPGLVWGLSTARAYALVNRQLGAAGSDERLFAVGGGNELQAFLLTPELAMAVADLASTRVDEAPYIPSEEYPWFGRPHREPAANH